MIALAGFPKLGSAFAASSLGVPEVGTDQLARIVEREPSAAMNNIARGRGLAASAPNVLTMTRPLSRSRPELIKPGVVEWVRCFRQRVDRER
ncbi:MAG: hypothetical protein LC808_35505 [Actinobacteria bacterium]|nr:hypothetical protein [Actinomycetota bacterium]